VAQSYDEFNIGVGVLQVALGLMPEEDVKAMSDEDK